MSSCGPTVKGEGKSETGDKMLRTVLDRIGKIPERFVGWATNTHRIIHIADFLSTNSNKLGFNAKHNEAIPNRSRNIKPNEELPRSLANNFNKTKGTLVQNAA